MGSLKGQVAVITGASSGKGEGVAIKFAQLGCRLAIFGRNEDNLKRVNALCREAGLNQDQILNIPGDINKDEDRKSIVQKTVEKYGEINILVNNAGMTYFIEISEMEKRSVTKSSTQMEYCQHVKRLRANTKMAPHGVRVNAINPGSVVSNITRRPWGAFQDEESYQKFLEKQVSCQPLGRVGQPEDCAEAVAFLASESASFITGQILFVDGGRLRV